MWHPSQELDEQADGSLVMRLRVAGEGDLVRWILQHGARVEVREPEWLRERVGEVLREAAARYP